MIVINPPLPAAITNWINAAPLTENSGQSGAQTYFIDGDKPAYLKIAPKGQLKKAADMQSYFASKDLSADMCLYESLDRDYLIVSAIAGEDGVSDKHVAQPARLAEQFGLSLKRLHATSLADCPEQNRMAAWLDMVPDADFRQDHLDELSHIIGKVDAASARAEILANRDIIKTDALIHGDYCLPNIILDNWRFSGFIDIADAGVGDRHYDIAWGLWTIAWNLKLSKYADVFLDAYGRDQIDMDRLRICILLAAMD